MEVLRHIDVEYQNRRLALPLKIHGLIANMLTNQPPDWKDVALEALEALRLMNAHYDDLSKSNPGFMGKLCLQKYGLWNEALVTSEQVLARHKAIKTKTNYEPRPNTAKPPVKGCRLTR